MKINSLNQKTDNIFVSFDGEIINRDHYLVIKTLVNPNFYWGNIIYFQRAPQKGDYKTWCEIFDKEFNSPQRHHKTFAWDEENIGDISEFKEAGYDLAKSVVLTANQVHKNDKFNNNLNVKPISTDEEWEEVIKLQTASSDSAHLDLVVWEKFYRSQISRYRKMIEKNIGVWFGGFLNNKLVASLGLFKSEDMARYQIVSTHPDFRRQGLCGTIVYESAKYAFDKMNIKTLVMVADEEYHAAKIYESVGFKPTEKAYGVCWFDKSKT